jgi:hypothetical protein
MATIHGEMHGEHRQWLSDDALWRDELAIWQKEIDQALGGLTKLEEALREHGKGLQDHLETIAAEERKLRDHEHALADFERGGSGNELLLMARTHTETADKHVQQRQAHERLKKQHHTVRAYWSLLLKVLTQKT